MECLQSIALAYLDPGDKVVIPEYAFAFFRSATELAGAQVTLVPEKNFHVDIGSILQAVDESTNMVIFANPGNPTGTYLSRPSISQLRAYLPPSTLLVIDEAYAEFGPKMLRTLSGLGLPRERSVIWKVAQYAAFRPVILQLVAGERS